MNFSKEFVILRRGEGYNQPLRGDLSSLRSLTFGAWHLGEVHMRRFFSLEKQRQKLGFKGFTREKLVNS